jgi:DNA-binding CsgD family transcriptional regulator
MTAAGTGMDAQWADHAWRTGNTAAAIEVADHMLSADTDPDHLAAGVAAAAAAADGALGESADRWRHVAEALPGVPGALAGGRAALAASLIGDTAAAAADLTAARALVPGAAPRGLTVLFDAVEATAAAVLGEFSSAARQLAGLAVATVPADPMAAERWDELAVAVTIAGGADRTASDMLAAHRDRPTTTRRRLLDAWLDLRAGRLADARAGLAAAGGTPTMRRDAVLAAAITVGLARRAGDDEALRATWYRVVPVISGTDVEPLLLDAWGELSVGAALVSPAECTTIVSAMETALTRVGRPAWALAVHAWWAVQRAAALDDPVNLVDDEFGDWFPVRAAAARCWAVVLSGSCDPIAVRAASQALTETGQPWEGAALCAAGARRLDDPTTARELLAAGRAMRATIVTAEVASTGGLSTRERSVGELLLDGLTHKEIGARLYISPKTVEQHVARLRQKLLAGNRSELVAALRVKLSVAAHQQSGRTPARHA